MRIYSGHKYWAVGIDGKVHHFIGTIQEEINGGWSHKKPAMKGGHRHRRNWAVCSYCGKWHRNKKAFGQCESKWNGKMSFCSYPCSCLAEGESFYGETGEPWEPHFFND